MIDMSVKSEIQVSCKDQLLKITDAPILASGGLNEVRVVFSFCEKWKGFAKTALFYREPENIYYAVLDSNDTCVVPWEVCYEEGTFFFGVFGERDNTRRTSSTVRYKVKNGAITSEMLPSDPTPAVYDQIMALFAEAIEQSKSFRAEAEVVIEATKQATTGALTATEDANTSSANAQKATADAITATENANIAASNANTIANNAANIATTSANNADVATANAITATNNANTATDRANTAADNANTATANANTATARANNSAINADAATSNANTATSNANQATQNANTAANTANTQAGMATQATENAITATQNANNAASDARIATEETNTARENIQQTASEVLTSLSNAVFAPPIESSASGAVVAVNDASNYLLRGLTIYGKTTQNGTELETVGESGSIGVTVTDGTESNVQTLIVQTPNGLAGIPVSSGGNYTDESGQQRLCDYKDCANGVTVKRINTKVFDGTEDFDVSGIGTANAFFGYRLPANVKAHIVAHNCISMCSHFQKANIATSTTTQGYLVRDMSDSGITRVLLRPENVASMTEATFKTWLAEQHTAGTPVTVQYELETPVETPMTAEEIAAYAALHTNKPNTTVYNDAGAWLKLEYVADTKTYIDNQFTELQNAILSAGANI